MNTNDLLQHINNSKPEIRLGDNTYKLNTSYKIDIFVNAKQKEINKNLKENADYDNISAEINLVYTTLKLLGGKELSEYVESLDLSAENLMKLYTLIYAIRSGKTEDEALKEFGENDKKK